MFDASLSPPQLHEESLPPGNPPTVSARADPGNIQGPGGTWFAPGAPCRPLVTHRERAQHDSSCVYTYFQVKVIEKEITHHSAAFV